MQIVLNADKCAINGSVKHDYLKVAIAESKRAHGRPGTRVVKMLGTTGLFDSAITAMAFVLNAA